MKKLAIAAIAVLMMIPGLAEAKNMGGKFGVGFDQSLGGARGLAVTYWVNKSLGVDAILGLDTIIPDEGDTMLEFDFALGVRYNIARSKNANLAAGLMLDIGYKNDAYNGPGADGEPVASTQFNIEIPLVAEYFFSQHFAIHTKVGLLISLVPEEGNVLPAQGFGNGGAIPMATGIGFGSGNLFGSAGFTFYF